MADKLAQLFCQMIREDRARFFKRLSKRVVIYELEYDNKLYHVAYDQARNKLTTDTPIQVVAHG